MSCFLALECSMAEGSLALLKAGEKDLKCLAFKNWRSYFNGKYLENSHSDKLPLEINRVMNSSDKELSDLDFLAVGKGPGRWTGVRTAVSVVRTLSFCLNIPVYSVNSLRVCAEPFLTQSRRPVFSAINGFKGQVYFAEFHSEQEMEGKLHLLNFSDWCHHMEKRQRFLKEKNPICISDLEDFYTLPKKLKELFSFKKLYPDARYLAQIIFKQKEKRNLENWSQLQAFYLRSPLE